jgi:glycosyltransferase involved in cell wall biosynthesis
MKNNLPMITFITPTYNRAYLLESAIFSVVNQIRDIPFEREMIIVDDGSIDITSDIVKKHIAKYPENIRYFYQKNS